jgi:GT2 family glycosyltransferase
MKVKILIPYSLEKNLGKAYNEAMEGLKEDEWGCLCDIDTCFLTPDAGVILEEYAKRYPDAGILTCFTNRVSPLSVMQLLKGKIEEDANMRRHVQLAEFQKKYLYQVTEINRDISGMLMMISKRFWNEFQFSEDLKCLGVDTEYNRRIRAAGVKILRMDGMYLFHVYRMQNGIHYKSHLV